MIGLLQVLLQLHYSDSNVFTRRNDQCKVIGFNETARIIVKYIQRLICQMDLMEFYPG